MNLCKACGRKYADAMQMCPFCGAAQSYDPNAPAENPESTVDEAAPAAAPVPPTPTPPVTRPTPVPKPGLVVMGDAAIQKDPIRIPWLFILVLLVLAGAVAYALMPKQMAYGNLEPWAYDAKFCEDYENCAVVYVAPWCPACRTTLQLVLREKERWAEEGIGVAVIVGNDDLERCRQYADFIGDIAFIDRGDQIRRQQEIDTVPTWFRLDGDRKVQGKVDGTFRPLDYTFEKLGFYEAGTSAAVAAEGG